VRLASLPVIGWTEPLYGHKKGLAMRPMTLFVVVSAVVATATLARAGSYAPRVGQRHPDFTLPNIATGKPVSLSDFRGKKVLLIHFASW